VRIEFDPEANAVYVKLRDVAEDDYGETDVDDNGVVIDCDSLGRPRGYEFLAVRQRGIPTETLPSDVALRVSEFIASGGLQSQEPFSQEYDDLG
jgi:uncharacterized protein YuzE